MLAARHPHYQLAGLRFGVATDRRMQCASLFAQFSAVRITALCLLAVLPLSCCSPARGLLKLTKTGTVAQVKGELGRGLNVNTRLTRGGLTLLMNAAAYNSDPNVISALIAAGAEVNASDRVGRTALTLAAELNTNAEVITTLIHAGANPNVIDRTDRTPLLRAAEFNANPKVAVALVQGGADINAVRGFDGGTALMYAARWSKNPEVVVALIMMGAKSKVKDKFGKTALDYTAKNKSLVGTNALRLLSESPQ